MVESVGVGVGLETVLVPRAGRVLDSVAVLLDEGWVGVSVAGTVQLRDAVRETVALGLHVCVGMGVAEQVQLLGMEQEYVAVKVVVGRRV